MWGRPRIINLPISCCAWLTKQAIVHCCPLTSLDSIFFFYAGWPQWSDLYLLCICESPTVHVLAISAFYVASWKFCSLQDFCTHVCNALAPVSRSCALICLSIPNILSSSFYTFESTWWIGVGTFSMFQKLPCQHFLSSVLEMWNALPASLLLGYSMLKGSFCKRTLKWKITWSGCLRWRTHTPGTSENPVHSLVKWRKLPN